MMTRAFSRQRQQRARGLAVVEFAMVLPLLLILMFGVVDFGRVVLIKQVMINLSREASNLASRGTDLDDVISAVRMSSAPLNIDINGYVIVTEVERDVNGNAVISEQQAAGGRSSASRVGSGEGNPAVLPVTNPELPLPGQRMFVSEVFYNSPPITPLGRLVNITLGEDFYDAAYF